jgi:RNA ligase (TIGR02306 family)
MSGQAEPAADLMSWVDIGNIKRYPDIFEPGEPVIATEKVHGTCCLLTYVRATGEVFVSSKGYGAKHVALAEEAGNLYWRAIRAHGVDVAAKKVADEFNADRVGIFGEVYGAGVLDLHYGDSAKAGAPGYAVFDVKVDIGGEEYWLNQDVMVDQLTFADPAIRIVPRLYEGVGAENWVTGSDQRVHG